MSDEPVDGTARGPEHALATSRLIDAPRERVFQAFIDPEQLARWWGPKDFSNTFQTFDPRPGGAWRFVMHGPDGKDYANESVFVAVDSPSQIVFDHRSGHHFRMTLTFTAQGERTLVGWHQQFDSGEECRRIAAVVLEANEQNLDRLEALLRALS